MPDKRLFLLGGSAAFEAAADEFVTASGGRDATIVLLLQGGNHWEKYVPDYVQPWTRRGVSRYHSIAPDENETLDWGAVSSRIQTATGIFVGGGHTPTYQRLYATEPVRSLLRESYNRGVPIAGCSAGALIAAEICPLFHDETDDGSLKIAVGLGLISGLVVGVHFTERKALPDVLAAMAQTQTKTGWGIDEPACAMFENGQFKQALGQTVHEIVMTDFATQTYRVTEHATSPGDIN
jgi:cyanophycinase